MKEELNLDKNNRIKKNKIIIILFSIIFSSIIYIYNYVAGFDPILISYSIIYGIIYSFLIFFIFFSSRKRILIREMLIGILIHFIVFIIFYYPDIDFLKLLYNSQIGPFLMVINYYYREIRIFKKKISIFE